jgi:hypothetical protein
MIRTVHDKILDFTGVEKVPCVVVGQKNDLAGDRWVCIWGGTVVEELHPSSRNFIPELRETGMGRLALVIRTDVNCADIPRRVSVAEGEELAKKIGAAFVESSAKDNKNVGEYFSCLFVKAKALTGKAFEILLGEMQRVYNPAPEKKKAGWFSWGKWSPSIPTCISHIYKTSWISWYMVVPGDTPTFHIMHVLIDSLHIMNAHPKTGIRVRYRRLAA